MPKRRRTVQHLWNRFMAAVLFVLGAALSTAAPTESPGNARFQGRRHAA